MVRGLSTGGVTSGLAGGRSSRGASAVTKDVGCGWLMLLKHLKCGQYVNKMFDASLTMLNLLNLDSLGGCWRNQSMVAWKTSQTTTYLLISGKNM